MQHRVDIVFAGSESDKAKQFVKRYENETGKRAYNLKGDDKLESPFAKFVQSNRCALATAVKQCWMERSLIDRLPTDRLLVVGGPDLTGIKLQKGLDPTPDYILESTQVETNTRMMLHANAISVDQQHKAVFVQTSE